jgi:hypothetical protein
LDLTEDNLDNPIEHWYYSYKFSAILKALGSRHTLAVRLVDVGAGSALFSRELARRNPKLMVTAIDINYTESELLDHTENFKRTSKFTDEIGEIYLMNDVLEHIEDDRLFLKSITDSAPNEALFVFTVPAMMSLWSGHDVYLKHFRRYTKKELNMVISSSGLSISDSYYMFGTLYPLALLIRRLGKQKIKSQLKPHANLTNSVIKNFLTIDHLIGHKLPFGVSLICVATKS